METGVDTASVLVLLPQRHGGRGRVFECKTCGRRFPTFQALGGHRASHRRPRPYGAPGLRRATVEAHEESECAGGGRRRTVHGCPVCGLEFAVGQALGGHMRRHRTTAADAKAIRAGNATTLVKDADAAAGYAGGICLDLNLATSQKCAKCRNNAVCGGVQGTQKTMLLDCPL